MDFKISTYNQGRLEELTVRNDQPAPAKFADMPRSLSQEQVKIENPRNIWDLYTDTFADLNPDQIKWILETARKGLNWGKSLLFEHIRRVDLHIGGVCQTRKYAVAKKAWEIDFPDEIKKEGDPEQEEMLKFFRDNFKRIGVVKLSAEMTEAQLQGVSTFEINYDTYDGKIGFKNVKYKQNHILMYDDIDDMYLYMDRNKSDALVLTPYTLNSLQDRIDVKEFAIPNLSPMKILEVHALDGNAQNGFQNGCIDGLIWAYFFKNYGLKDFGMYIERLGIPAIIAKYDPLMNADERSALFTALKNWGRLFKMMVPNTAEVDLLTDQTKAQTGNLFKEYIDIWDNAISIRVLGQTLTTSVSDKGTQALGTVHNTVREDLIEADMSNNTDGFNELVKRLGDLNYPGKQLPEWRYKERANVDHQLKRAEIFTHVKNAGYRVSKETIESELDLQVEDEPINDAPPPQAEEKKEEDKNKQGAKEEEKKDNKLKNDKEDFTQKKFKDEVSEKETNDFLERIFDKSKK